MGGKGNGKGRKHPEAAIRMNFLHQAAACVLKSTGNKVLSAALGSHMVAVGQKSQVRLSKEIKRTVCKGCHLLLVPGASANVTVTGPRKEKSPPQDRQSKKVKTELPKIVKSALDSGQP